MKKLTFLSLLAVAAAGITFLASPQARAMPPVGVSDGSFSPSPIGGGYGGGGGDIPADGNVPSEWRDGPPTGDVGSGQPVPEPTPGDDGYRIPSLPYPPPLPHTPPLKPPPNDYS